MKTNPLTYPKLLVLFILMIGLAACDTLSSTDVDDVDADIFASAADASEIITTMLTQELNLTVSEQAAVETAFTENNERDAEPGHLWYVAAALQDTLGEEEKATLIAKTENFPIALKIFAAGYGLVRPHRGLPNFRGLILRVLTEAQKETYQTIIERYNAEKEALKEALRNEEITAEEFLRQMQELIEAIYDEVYALLTEEQKAELEELISQQEAKRAEFKAAVKAAMIDAMGLSDEQVAALDALFAEFEASLQELQAQARSGGFDSREAFRAAVMALHDETDTALGGILNDVQYEIAQIYVALTIRDIRNHEGNGGFGVGGGGRDLRAAGGFGPAGGRLGGGGRSGGGSGG